MNNIDFEKLTKHSKRGMPLTREYRFFVLDGQIVFASEYWDEGDYAGTNAPLRSFAAEMAAVSSRFFAMDIALSVHGQWLIVELGDGQVAGLPSESCADSFYDQLRS